MPWTSEVRGPSPDRRSWRRHNSAMFNQSKQRASEIRRSHCDTLPPESVVPQWYTGVLYSGIPFPVAGTFEDSRPRTKNSHFISDLSLLPGMINTFFSLRRFPSIEAHHISCRPPPPPWPLLLLLAASYRRVSRRKGKSLSAEARPDKQPATKSQTSPVRSVKTVLGASTRARMRVHACNAG